MGKPFGHELALIPSTIKWANELNIEKLHDLINKYHHPVYVVGSGGSFSACIYADVPARKTNVGAHRCVIHRVANNHGVVFLRSSGS